MIDRGEALVAVVGMRRVIDRSLRYITVEEREKAVKLEARIDAMATQLCNGTLSTVDTPQPVDYDSLLTRFTEPPTTDELQMMIRSIPGEDHDDAAAFLAVAGGVWKFLGSMFPIVVKRNLYGAENLPPSDVALTRFDFLLQVLDDPLVTFDLMAQGALLRMQGQALQACYPSIFYAIVSAISTRVLSTEYDPMVCLQLSALTGAPYQDPQVTMAMAATDQAQAVKEQAQAQQARSSQPKESRTGQMMAPPSAAPR